MSKITQREKIESNLIPNDIALTESTRGVWQEGKLRRLQGMVCFIHHRAQYLEQIEYQMPVPSKQNNLEECLRDGGRVEGGST